MRIFAIAALVLAACSAHAQTEREIMSWVEEGQKRVTAGDISELQFHRELYRRIAATPSSIYPWKAENLRIVGYRVELYEDVEAGKLTRERAERRIAEQQAQWEAESKERERAVADADYRARMAAYERQKQAQAQDEANRRSMALQLLQSGAFAVRPTQIPFTPMQVAPQVNCTSNNIGGTVHTNCR